jgi:hypothetical protein
MKKITRIVVMSAALALAAGAVDAQTTNVYLQAYLVLNGVRQNGNGQAASVRIIDKDILAALNATGNFNFSSGARLLLKSNDDQLPTFVVREPNGDTSDVSNYLSVDEVSEVNAQNGMISYAVWVFAFNNQEGTSFSVSGFLTLYRGTLKSAHVGPLMRVYNIGGQVAGAGQAGGNEAVFRGVIAAGFPTVEVDR